MRIETHLDRSMNHDLKIRLMPLEHALVNREVGDFFDEITDTLLDYTYNAKCPYLSTGDIVLKLEPIENDEDDSAYMTYDGEVFEVVIDSRMPMGMVFDFLIHELAHILSWHYDEPDDHGPQFGIGYATLYRLYLRTYEEYGF